MAETQTPSRVVRHLSIAYFEPFTSPDGKGAVLVRTARRGELVDTAGMAAGEEKRLDGLGAFMPAGAESADAFDERAAVLDLYRGQRGDMEAYQRAMTRAQGQPLVDTTSGVVDLTAADAATTTGPVAGNAASVGKLADHITAEKLTVDDTIALAEDDPEMARRVMEAERLASGDSPRAGVLTGLEKIIGA